MVKCVVCGGEMRVTRRFLSTNTKYAELVCTSCFNHKIACEGVRG